MSCNCSSLPRLWRSRCGNWELLVITHRCVMCSSAFPKLWLQRSSCCTVGLGRYWGSGGGRRHFPPRQSLAPSVARCSSTSDGRAGSSHSGTRFRKLCRERCPLEGQGRGQRGHDISAFIFMHKDKDKKELVHMHTLPVLTLKASVKRLFHQILRRCISLRCYHGVGALSQGQTRTLDHLLTEASLLS